MKILYPPQFLSERELRALKRDSCVFCQGKFEVEKEEHKTEWVRRGEYYDHIDHVLVRTYNIIEPDIYSFVFKFDEEELKERERAIVVGLEIRRKREAEELRVRLERELTNLPERERGIAIDSIVEDYLSGIKKPDTSSIWASTDKSELEIEVEKLFHNLQLGDLQLSWDTGYYCSKGVIGVAEEEGSKPSGVDCVHTYYHPVGLKSHKGCWPFKHFYGSVSFAIKFGELFVPLKRNQAFGNYEALFKEHQELWGYILGRQITIEAEAHKLSGDFI